MDQPDMIVVKFYMNGDATLYTQEFESQEEYNIWWACMVGSVEIFSERIPDSLAG